MSKYLELVEGSFTQEHFDKQKNQKPYVAYSIQDGKAIYTIITNKEEEKYTIYRAINYVDISNCTYNMVDLGLSVKWADRNVGAKSPEHYGSYFQWGDTNPYTYIGELTTQELVDLLNPLIGPGITVDNVKEVLASQGVTGNDLTEVVGYVPELNREFINWDSYFDTTDGGSTFNKYYNNGGLIVLEPEDDAAYVHMGSNYRMPNVEEINELINNTTQTFIDLDGNEYDKQYVYDNEPIESGKLKGVRFTSSNGNSIFIPAAGGCYENILMNGYGSILWSSNLNNKRDSDSIMFSTSYSGFVILQDNFLRYVGLPVRGVEN